MYLSPRCTSIEIKTQRRSRSFPKWFYTTQATSWFLNAWLPGTALICQRYRKQRMELGWQLWTVNKFQSNEIKWNQIFISIRYEELPAKCTCINQVGKTQEYKYHLRFPSKSSSLRLHGMGLRLEFGIGIGVGIGIGIGFSIRVGQARQRGNRETDELIYRTGQNEAVNPIDSMRSAHECCGDTYNETWSETREAKDTRTGPSGGTRDRSRETLQCHIQYDQVQI